MALKSGAALMLLQPLLLILLLQRTAAQVNIRISVPSQDLPPPPVLGIYDRDLEPSKEKPQVENTSANGEAHLNFNTPPFGPNLLDYELKAFDAYRISEAHIHKGNDSISSDEAPIVLWLYPPHDSNKDDSALTNPPNVTTDGTFAKGTADSSQLVGPLKGKGISDLYSLAQQNNLFINVHNLDYPGGLLRSSQF